MKKNTFLIIVIIVLLFAITYMYNFVLGNKSTSKVSSSNNNTINLDKTPRINIRNSKDTFLALSSSAYIKMAQYMNEKNSDALVKMVDDHLIIAIKKYDINGMGLEKFGTDGVKIRCYYDGRGLKEYDKLEGYLPLNAVQFTSLPSDVDIQILKSLESTFNTQLYQGSGFDGGPWNNNIFSKDSIFTVRYLPTKGQIEIDCPVDSKIDIFPINTFLDSLFPQNKDLTAKISQELKTIINKAIQMRKNTVRDIKETYSINGHKLSVSVNGRPDSELVLNIDLLGENKSTVDNILNNK
jgi:hypothetical protein